MTTYFEIRLAKFLGYCLERCEKSAFALDFFNYSGITTGNNREHFITLINDEFRYDDLVKSLKGLVDL